MPNASDEMGKLPHDTLHECGGFLLLMELSYICIQNARIKTTQGQAYGGKSKGLYSMVQDAQQHTSCVHEKRAVHLLGRKMHLSCDINSWNGPHPGTLLSCVIQHSGKASVVVIFRALEGGRAMRISTATILFGAFGIFSASLSAQAEEANTRVATMPYSECLAIIAEASSEVGEAPVQLINNEDETSVRINAADGFVTVSCSRANNKMVLSKSPVPEAAGMTASR